MKAKRILALLLAAMMVLALVACGNSGDKKQDATEAGKTDTKTDTKTPATADPIVSTWNITAIMNDPVTSQISARTARLTGSSVWHRV